MVDRPQSHACGQANRPSGRPLWPVLMRLTQVALLLAWGASGGQGLAAQPHPQRTDAWLWRGEYYANTTMAGAPALVRNDTGIDFHWGTGTPIEAMSANGGAAEGFSVRWTTLALFATGDYTFSLTLSGGGRLWVDEQLLIDAWNADGKRTQTAAKTLTAGHYSLRVEYRSRSGDSLCQLSWSSEAPVDAWRAEYYANTWLGGAPTLVRNDEAIGIVRGEAELDGGFSVRWTRTVYLPASGSYTFVVTATDGVRLWVDDVVLIDRWFSQAQARHDASRYLSAGVHHLKLEYFGGEDAICALEWGPGVAVASAGPSIEVVVDDRDAGFAWEGDEEARHARATGYRGGLHWTWNSDTRAQNAARWHPNLPSAGLWEVFVYVPSRYHSTDHATYAIYHAGGRSERTISQAMHRDEWVSLGTYAFGGGPGEYVYLNDQTGEPPATRMVGFDALKLVLRDGAVAALGTPYAECLRVPVLGFGTIWRDLPAVRGTLGCATGPETHVLATEILFQGGYAFWRHDLDRVYVLYAAGTVASGTVASGTVASGTVASGTVAGTYQVYANGWSATDAEPTDISPPPGYLAPTQGLGLVWREGQGVRDRLGWATGGARTLYAALQPYEHGFMYWSNTRGVYVLYEDHTWQRFD